MDAIRSSAFTAKTVHFIEKLMLFSALQRDRAQLGTIGPV